MDYKITTGCLERGTDEQKGPFVMMLGENAQHKFDLYFHWYNIVHEYGHCLLDFHKHDSCGVLQEMLVNQFAVSYWKARGFQDSLNELRAMLEATLANFPCPVPAGEDFIGWYEKIWNTELLMSVPVYGYLQFKSVLMALDEMPDLAGWLKKAGIKGFSLPENSAFQKKPAAAYPIEAASAPKVLADLMAFLETAGVVHPEVCVELADDPSQHFCRPV